MAWAIEAAPRPLLASPSVTSSTLRRCGGTVRRWLSGRPEPLTVPAEAERLLTSWGSLALDVARARSARAEAGFFDEPSEHFWTAVSREVRRRQAGPHEGA